MKCHFLYFTPPADSVTLKWSHPAFFSTISRADWPIYEVAKSESGSYFMAGINFGFTIILSCYYNTDFVKKKAILEDKNVKVHRHMHSANP